MNTLCPRLCRSPFHVVAWSHVVALLIIARASIAAAPATPSGPAAGAAVPGHSLHGEGFSEGPRRRLPLVPGCGDVHFPVTTTSPEAQAFFNQGIGQLHGFWFWEAERSFRTVLQIDPACAMAHWGMAMANIRNESRARQLIAKASGPGLAAVSPRERAWIEATRKLFAERPRESDRKQRFPEFTAAIERIALDHPEDLEARAFLVGFSWWSKDHGGPPPSSQLALDALARQVLAKKPRHPIHHYLIHLWDKSRPAEALRSAAECGPSAPGIAHMWHMPGHTYSELRRWQDAAWQQEAAARVDHAWMARAHLFPDQIHNFAHNSEWLCRNLNHLGRAREALAVATNLIAMPRIPRSKEVKPDPDQRFEEGDSAWQHGRDRLFETILRWELWELAACLADTRYLEPGKEFADRWRREQLLALAGYGRGDAAAGHAAFERLVAIDKDVRDQRMAAATAAETKARSEAKPAAAISKAMADAMQPFTGQLGDLEKPLAELRLRDHLAHGRLDEAKQLLPRIGDVHRARLAEIQLALGDGPKAIETARACADADKRSLHPRALLCWIQWQAGRRSDAVKTFAEVRTLAIHADDDLPLLRRLAPVAEAAGVAGDWREAVKPSADIGERPALDSLGPIVWRPWEAGAWTARTASDEPVDGGDLRGRDHVVILTLGQACSHCNQQVKAFGSSAKAFEQAGLPIVVISSDSPAEIRAAEPPPFPVYSGADGAAFRALDAWDDFEGKPLHATCLIAADGRMRWQHVGYEPFMLPDFLLEEAGRLRAVADQPACLEPR